MARTGIESWQWNEMDGFEMCFERRIYGTCWSIAGEGGREITSRVFLFFVFFLVVVVFALSNWVTAGTICRKKKEEFRRTDRLFSVVEVYLPPRLFCFLTFLHINPSLYPSISLPSFMHIEVNCSHQYSSPRKAFNVHFFFIFQMRKLRLREKWYTQGHVDNFRWTEYY